VEEKREEGDEKGERKGEEEKRVLIRCQGKRHGHPYIILKTVLGASCTVCLGPMDPGLNII
jgi:hypothetical protein